MMAYILAMEEFIFYNNTQDHEMGEVFGMTETGAATAPEGDGDQNVDELLAETLAEEAEEESAKARESVNIDEKKVEGEKEGDLEDGVKTEEEGKEEEKEEKEVMQADDGAEANGDGKLEISRAKESGNLGKEMAEEMMLMGGDQKEGGLEDGKEMEEGRKEEEKKGMQADDGAEAHGEGKLESSNVKDRSLPWRTGWKMMQSWEKGIWRMK